MERALIFWRQQPGLTLSAAVIAQELHVGNEVAGLIDLPVQEILARLKEAFPEAVEKAGELLWRSGDESFEATWSWQFVRIHVRDLSNDCRGRLIHLLESFDCPAYDAQLGIRLAH